MTLPAALQRVSIVLLFMNVLAAGAVFRVRDFADKSMDTQVLLKLGVWVASGAFALALAGRWAPGLLRADRVALLPLLALACFSCFYAPNMVYSAASAFSLVAVCAFCASCSSLLTRRQIMTALAFSAFAISLLSIAVYFINPDFGRMKTWTDEGLVAGVRLTGITGTANVIGYVAAIGLLLLYYLRPVMPRGTGWIVFGGALVNLAALVMSQSRTSMAALVLALFLSALARGNKLGFLLACSAFCAVLSFGVLMDPEVIFSMLSRSGDAGEITTGTGRTQIWAAAADLIAQRPVLGWGYASSNSLLPAAGGAIGHAVTHAHNAFLQIALSNGLAGLGVFLLLVAMRLYYALRARDGFILGLIFFMVLGGLTEPVAFFGVAGMSTIVLALVATLDYVDPDEARHTSYQRGLSRPAAA